MDVRRAFARVSALVGTTVVVAASLTTAAVAAPIGTPGTVSVSGSPVLNDNTYPLALTTSDAFPSSPAPAPTVVISRTGNPGDAVTVTSVKVGSGGTSKSINVIADFTIANPGMYDVEVYLGTSGNKTVDDLCTSCLSVLGRTPVVTGVSPSQLAERTKPLNSNVPGYQNFVISGQDFARGQYTQCSGTVSDCATGPNVAIRNNSTGISDANITLGPIQAPGDSGTTTSGIFATATQITMRIIVKVGSETAPYYDDVTVTNSNGKTSTCVKCLQIFPAPTITSVALQATGGNTIGRNATGQTLVITGQNFAQTANQVVFATTATSPGTITGGTPQISTDGTTITIPNVNTTAVTSPNGVTSWTATVIDATLHAQSNAGGFSVDEVPAPTDVSYTTNPLPTNPRDYGQGAQNVVLSITAGSGAFVAGTGDATTHTHAVFTNLPAGVTITAEEADTGSPNTVRETLSIAPGASLGQASIKLVNPDGGTSINACNVASSTCFLTVVAAPAVSSLNPATFVAGTTNGQLVLIGTNFHPAGSPTNNTIRVKIAVPNGGPTFVNAAFTPGTGAQSNQVVVTGIAIPGNTPAGDADVTITNTDDNGVSVCAACFHVSAVSVNSVVPDRNTGATNDADSPITVYGDNFASTATFTLKQAGVADIPMTLSGAVTNPGVTGSSATGTVPLAGVAPGFYDVVVTNPANDLHAGTGVCTACFRVVASAPTATSVSPTAVGGGASNVNVTLTGTNIFPGAQMSFSSSSITLVGDPTIAANHTSITQAISVAANAASEIGTVTVFNTDGQQPSSPPSFTVDPAPVVNAISPATRPNGAHFTLTINGSGFSTGAALPTVTFGNNGVTGTVLSVSNAGDAITVDTTIGSNVASTNPVAVHVTVTNPDQGNAQSPTDLTVDPLPTVGSTSPSAVAAGSTTEALQIIGTGFQPGATVAPHAAGEGLTFGTPTVVSATEIDVPLTVDPAAAKGARQFDVTNPDTGVVTSSLSVFTTPSVPQTVTATGGVRQVTVQWAAPADNGGSALTSYTVTLTKQGAPTTTASFTTADATTTQHTFTTIGDPAAGLADNTAYVAKVLATNAAGNSAAAPTNGVTASTFNVPSAPNSLSITPGDHSLAIGWAAPASDGGSAVTSYTVSVTPSGGNRTSFTTADASTTTHTFSSLTNDTAYAVSVVATNAVGDGTAATGSGTPEPPPGAATVTVTPGNGSLAASWSLTQVPGHPATEYDVTVAPHGGSVTQTFVTKSSDSGGIVTAHTFSGLTNGQLYDVAVTAANDIGTGPASTTTGTPRTTPQAPTGVTVAAGDGRATVSWTAPADNGGDAITHYVVTANPGHHTVTTTDGTARSAIVTGLANGTAYGFSVVAQNAAGNGAASSPLVVATPRYVTTPSIRTNHSTVGYGAKVTLSGKVIRSGGAPVTGQDVLLFRAYDGQPSHGVARIKTDANGAWSFTYAPTANARYYVRFLGDTADAPSVSGQVRTTVAALVRITSPADNTTSSHRTPLVLKGTVAPNKAGARVTLYYYDAHGNRVALASTTLTRSSTFAFSVALGKGTWVLRVSIGATAGNVAGGSPLLHIRRT